MKFAGFPEGSILFEPSFEPIGAGVRYRPDFAIVHPESKEPLAIIEVKGEHVPQGLERGIEQLSRYVDALKDKSIKPFLALSSGSDGKFTFFIPEDGKPKEVPSSSLLNYEALLSSRYIEKKEHISEEKKETTDQFVKVCRWVSFVVLLLVIGDFILSLYDIKLLTTERMVLLTAAIALIIIPYAQKFKGLGVEWERYSGSKKG